MRRIKGISIAISAAALAMCGIAYAQMSGDKAGFDANSDGVIARAEAQAAAKAMFAKFDANKDGKLDQSDREAHHQEMRGKMFEMLDTDKDGSISKQEFMAGKRPGREGMRGHHGAGMGKHLGKHGGGHGMMMMQKADADNDGAVSQAEFLAAANKRFDMADANKDGNVTKEEREAAREKMKAEWKARKAEKTGTSN
ncbi:hypothetical protein GCM10011494_03210 [Novosphingobium endophyticum]|uniref:EF-hand domain-containing protein n=1 Tax=Novosphingobium endophyticum TaxID=1955250 RepID=A0A916TPQ9_9SPHN|nr:EF-hand domain-containing protein [Novosphingobium endophyticum]GGB88263.1 hypothetical protein GCM10011494_03210 [Novosphingobium endophyticum]